MQLANKYNPLFTIILAIALSLSLLCINLCEADDTRFHVCYETADYKDGFQELCNQTLSSNENPCGPAYGLRCMGIFVNAQAINATGRLLAVATNASRAPTPAPGGGGDKQKPVQSCVSHFKSAISRLRQCKGLLSKRNLWSPKNITSKSNRNTLNMIASAAETYLDTCDDEITGKPDNFTEHVKDIISVELAIINKLPVE